MIVHGTPEPPKSRWQRFCDACGKVFLSPVVGITLFSIWFTAFGISIGHLVYVLITN